MLSFSRHTSISSVFNAIRWEWFLCVARCKLSALIGEGKLEERCSSGYYTVSAMSFQLHFQLSHSPPTTSISAKKKLETVMKPLARVLTAHVMWVYLLVDVAEFVFIAVLSHLVLVFTAQWAQAGNWKWNPLEHHSPSKTGGGGGMAGAENLLLPYWPKFQWCIYKITPVHGYGRCFFV